MISDDAEKRCVPTSLLELTSKVPVMYRRRSAMRSRQAMATCVRGFLTVCASSRITLPSQHAADEVDLPAPTDKVKRALATDVVAAGWRHFLQTLGLLRRFRERLTLFGRVLLAQRPVACASAAVTRVMSVRHEHDIIALRHRLVELAIWPVLQGQRGRPSSVAHVEVDAKRRRVLLELVLPAAAVSSVKQQSMRTCRRPRAGRR